MSETIIRQRLAEFEQYLSKIVAVPSVKAAAVPGAPYGPGPRQVLTTVTEIANQLGLRTGITANRVAWAEAGPDTADYIGILGHLDVVDVGPDWDTPPFTLTIRDGKMFGRGALDNKGPIMGALFALAMINDTGTPLKRRIRVMFGSDEESGSSDIPAYLAVTPAPSAGFTPDGKYPVVFAERGIIGLKLTYAITDGSGSQVAAINGDFGRSYTPDAAHITYADGSQTEYTGVRSPSNAPDMGVNVIKLLADAKHNFTGDLADFWNWLRTVMTDTKGTGLDVAVSDAASGNLQMSVYAIDYTATAVTISLSMRYPVTVQPATLLARITAAVPSAVTVDVIRNTPSLYNDPTAPMIQIMQREYEAVTGTDGTPVTTTGMTYARTMPNIVAFGPSFPGQRGIAHKGNEWLATKDWIKMIGIDERTMVALANEL